MIIMKKPIKYGDIRKKLKVDPTLKKFKAQFIEKNEKLLVAIKTNLPKFKALLVKINDTWCYEDYVYRFYHRSYKVFSVQELTLEVVRELQALMPEQELNRTFIQIINEGTGQVFEREHNQNWPGVTRPILEAFFHCKYYLEMLVKYGEHLNELPNPLPSGCAAILALYGLR